LYVTEDNAVASSKQLREWFLFLRACEEKKMPKLHKNKEGRHTNHWYSLRHAEV